MRRPFLAAACLLHALSLAASAQAGGPTSRHYADDTQGIFWFLHVSDLHLDTNEPTQSQHLEFLLKDAVQVLEPRLVIASGDLVDGTLMGIPTSGQDQAEWDIYKGILDDANVQPTWFFDLPGNHDGYGDNGLTHFLANSMQGQATGKLFSDTTITTSLGDYYFACLNSAGTYNKPFTFGNPSFTNVEDLTAGLQAHKSAQLVFAFAHHHLVPRGATDAQTQLGIGGADNPPDNVAEVVPLLEEAGAFYFHGHVHQFKECLQGNLVTFQISSLGHEPAVDRSSVDAFDATKYASNIGVGIVDHNAFVYRVTDTTNPWPFVAITAPVDVNLQGGGIPAGTENGVSFPGDAVEYGAQKNPYAYDVCGPNKNNPVRALVLAAEPVTSVTFALDGSTIGPMTAAADPKGIYTATIDTSSVKPGLHALTVTATAGNVSRWDAIQVNITGGPCAPEQDAGTDAPAGDSAVADAAGMDAAVDHEAGATTDAGDSGSDAAVPPEPEEAASDDGGCSCSVPGRSSAGAGALAWALVLGLLRRRSG